MRRHEVEGVDVFFKLCQNFMLRLKEQIRCCFTIGARFNDVVSGSPLDVHARKAIRHDELLQNLLA